MSDAREAAERLRRVNDGENPVDVYDPQKPEMRLGEWGRYERKEAANQCVISDQETLADAYLARQDTSDAAILVCIEGAKELGQSLADAVKQIEWLRLLWIAGRAGAIYWTSYKRLALASSGLILEHDADGIPLHTPELEAALRTALNIPLAGQEASK